MFPIAKTTMDKMSSLRRLKLPVSAVSTGELSARANVKAVTSCPAVDTETERSAAIFGNSGAIIKLSVPMAKVPRAIQ